MTVTTLDWASWSGKGTGPANDGHPSTIYRSWIDKGPRKVMEARVAWMVANGVTSGVAWVMGGAWQRKVIRFWDTQPLVTEASHYGWYEWLIECVRAIQKAHDAHGVTIYPYVGDLTFATDDHFEKVMDELANMPAKRLYCDRAGMAEPGSPMEWRIAKLREDYGFEVIAEALPSQFAASITDGGCAVVHNGSAERSYAEAGNRLFGPTTIYVSGDSMIDDAKLWIRRAAEDGVDLKLAANRPSAELRAMATETGGR